MNIKEAFGGIKAEEALKNSTREFIAAKTRRYTRSAASKRRFYVYGTVFACLAVLFLGGYRLYFTPTSEIDIKINPFIELSVNRFDRIVSVKGLNEDGRELAKTLDLSFKPYSEGVELIIANETISAMLSDNKIMSITVSGSDEEQSERILSDLEVTASRHSNVYCHHYAEDINTAISSEHGHHGGHH